MNLVSIKELAEKIDYSKSHIYKLIERKKNPLPVHYVHGMKYIDLDEYKIWAKTYTFDKKKRNRGNRRNSCRYEEKEYIKENYGVISIAQIARNLKRSTITIRKVVRELGIENKYKPSVGRDGGIKKKRNILPEYPSSEKFYLNYQISWFLYCQLLAEKRKIYE